MYQYNCIYITSSNSTNYKLYIIKKKVRIEVLDERFLAMHLGMLCKIFQGGIFPC